MTTENENTTDGQEPSVSLSDIELLKQKVYAYEALLHSINLYAEVTMDKPALAHIIHLICDWSLAHRDEEGNFSLEDSEEVLEQFERILSMEWRSSARDSNVETEFKKRYAQNEQPNSDAG